MPKVISLDEASMDAPPPVPGLPATRVRQSALLASALRARVAGHGRPNHGTHRSSFAPPPQNDRLSIDGPPKRSKRSRNMC